MASIPQQPETEATRLTLFVHTVTRVDLTPDDLIYNPDPKKAALAKIAKCHRERTPMDEEVVAFSDLSPTELELERKTNLELEFGGQYGRADVAGWCGDGERPFSEAGL
jgi:hypothetical protein